MDGSKSSHLIAAWRLRPAQPSDLPAARALIASCGLPLDGLDDQFGEGYGVALRETTLIGIAGVERYGRYGLLRSVAVEESQRGSRVGTALVEDRVRWCRRTRVGSLFLLTTTADQFFAGRGFEVIARESVPAEIRASKEFASACPASAVVMRRELL
jgi:amino-acid N-acetyltransferase